MKREWYTAPNGIQVRTWDDDSLWIRVALSTVGPQVAVTIRLPSLLSSDDLGRKVADAMAAAGEAVIRTALAERSAEDQPIPYRLADTLPRSTPGQPHAEARPTDMALMTPAGE